MQDLKIEEVKRSIPYKSMVKLLKNELPGFIDCNIKDPNYYNYIIIVDITLDAVEFFSKMGLRPTSYLGPKYPVSKEDIDYFNRFKEVFNLPYAYLSVAVDSSDKAKADQLESDINEMLRDVSTSPVIPDSHKLMGHNNEIKIFALGSFDLKFNFDDPKKIELWKIIKSE